jgi:hypothetical protein
MARKHSKGWVAMAAMPTNNIQPHPYISGLKGCGGCHRVGVKPEEEKKYSKYGMNCNSCHTRHVFSKAEAQKPQACQTATWASTTRSGRCGPLQARLDRALGTDPGAPRSADLPHARRRPRRKTAWLPGVRLPEDDAEWMGHRATILKGLQVLDPTASLPRV